MSTSARSGIHTLAATFGRSDQRLFMLGIDPPPASTPEPEKACWYNGGIAPAGLQQDGNAWKVVCADGTTCSGGDGNMPTCSFPKQAPPKFQPTMPGVVAGKAVYQGPQKVKVGTETTTTKPDETAPPEPFWTPGKVIGAGVLAGLALVGAFIAFSPSDDEGERASNPAKPDKKWKWPEGDFTTHDWIMRFADRLEIKDGKPQACRGETIYKISKSDYDRAIKEGFINKATHDVPLSEQERERVFERGWDAAASHERFGSYRDAQRVLFADACRYGRGVPRGLNKSNPQFKAYQEAYFDGVGAWWDDNTGP